MRFTVTGSGGCVSLPRPLCQCPVCVQARAKGVPYARHGCSLYCHDASLLIDTPEDIVPALNASDIRRIDAIAYSHWDPDHTMGMRVVEQLRLNWLALSVKDFHPEAIRVLALDGVLADVNNLRNPFGSFMDYYEHMGLIRREAVADSVALGDITLTLVPVDDTRRVTVFVFEQNGHRLMYAPCDVKPFPDSPRFQGADVLILGNTMIGPTLKGGFVLTPDNPLLKEVFSMDEALALRDKYGIGELVFTHMEEDWGKSYDDYRAMEETMPGVRFAFDGMEIVL